MNNSIETKINFMRIALEQAETAYNNGEIPVGAVIVYKDKLITKSHNMNRRLNNPLKHAEIICIEEAANILNNERLTNCELFVTKEPCAMCSGAIINARIKKVIIAAEDNKYGACGTVIDVCGNKKLNHVPEIEFGILREEASNLLKEFFKGLRETKGNHSII